MTVKEWLKQDDERRARIAKQMAKPMTPAQLRQWYEMRESRAS